MASLVFDNLHKAYGIFPVLNGVSFTVGPGEKVGIVGPNGCGKSTLLRLALDLEKPTSGRAEAAGVSPGDIGYLEQGTAEMARGETLWDYCLAVWTKPLEMEAQLRHLEIKMAEPHLSDDPSEMDRLLRSYQRLTEDFEKAEGYGFRVETRKVVFGLGFSEDELEQPLAEMSGGMRVRAALARLLLRKPPVLILDEPTNHLDIPARRWLEGFMRDYSGTALFVSHDRHFLNAVADKVVNLEGGVAAVYRGNYDNYKAQRELEYREQMARFKKAQRQEEKLKYYVQRYKAGNRAKSAKGREKALARMERVDLPRNGLKAPSLSFTPRGKTRGNESVVAKELTHGYGGSLLFADLDFTIQPGERVALIGQNGTGKSTLLRLIAGDEEPLGGSVRLMQGRKVGFFTQDLQGLDPSQQVLQEIISATSMKPPEARSFLGRFLFSGDEVFKSVSELSGGERSRLLLAKLVAARVDVLLLDEPTNHLDLPAREALEAALMEFPGAIVFSSHDRYFVRQVATGFLAFTPDQEVVDARSLSRQERFGPAEEILDWFSSLPEGRVRASQREQWIQRDHPLLLYLDRWPEEVSL